MAQPQILKEIKGYQVRDLSGGEGSTNHLAKPLADSAVASRSLGEKHGEAAPLLVEIKFEHRCFREHFQFSDTVGLTLELPNDAGGRIPSSRKLYVPSASFSCERIRPGNDRLYRGAPGVILLPTRLKQRHRQLAIAEKNVGGHRLIAFFEYMQRQNRAGKQNDVWQREKRNGREIEALIEIAGHALS